MLLNMCEHKTVCTDYISVMSFDVSYNTDKKYVTESIAYNFSVKDSPFFSPLISIVQLRVLILSTLKLHACARMTE